MFKYTVLAVWMTTQSIFAVKLCSTPHEQPGDCKIITQCEGLYPLLRNRPIAPWTAQYLKNSHCGYETRIPKVCCPFNSSTIPLSVKPRSSPLLPTVDVCGGSTEDRIFGGNDTEIDEFPWMALLQYESPTGALDFKCEGMLISERYVLTAAHCVHKTFLDPWKLVNVRLGEHNTKTHPDCKKYFNSTDCAPDPVNSPIEDTIIHDNFNAEDMNFYHDVALLRLQQTIKFSDFVKPICLLTSIQEINRNYVGKKLWVAGWGETETRRASSVKLKVQVPVREFSQCSSIYKQFENIDLKDGQMCAGDKGVDACVGDSGGPLMTVAKNKKKNVYWYAVGMVSFGPKPCGQKNWPAVYTIISKYMQWIADKLRP